MWYVYVEWLNMETHFFYKMIQNLLDKILINEFKLFLDLHVSVDKLHDILIIWWFTHYLAAHLHWHSCYG